MHIQTRMRSECICCHDSVLLKSYLTCFDACVFQEFPGGAEHVGKVPRCEWILNIIDMVVKQFSGQRFVHQLLAQCSHRSHVLRCVGICFGL